MIMANTHPQNTMALYKKALNMNYTIASDGEQNEWINKENYNLLARVRMPLIYEYQIVCRFYVWICAYGNETFELNWCLCVCVCVYAPAVVAIFFIIPFASSVVFLALQFKILSRCHLCLVSVSPRTYFILLGGMLPVLLLLFCRSRTHTHTPFLTPPTTTHQPTTSNSMHALHTNTNGATHIW